MASWKPDSELIFFLPFLKEPVRRKWKQLKQKSGKELGINFLSGWSSNGDGYEYAHRICFRFCCSFSFLLNPSSICSLNFWKTHYGIHRHWSDRVSDLQVSEQYLVWIWYQGCFNWYHRKLALRWAMAWKVAEKVMYPQNLINREIILYLQIYMTVKIKVYDSNPNYSLNF